MRPIYIPKMIIQLLFPRKGMFSLFPDNEYAFGVAAMHKSEFPADDFWLCHG